MTDGFMLIPLNFQRVMHTTFPAIVIIFGFVSNKEDVIPPHFFLQGLRVNSTAYINVPDTFV